MQLLTGDVVQDRASQVSAVSRATEKRRRRTRTTIIDEGWRAGGGEEAEAYGKGLYGVGRMLFCR